MSLLTLPILPPLLQLLIFRKSVEMKNRVFFFTFRMTASKKVLRQVEYYFGNVNMMRDSFMKEEIKKDQGWITLETMMNVS